MNWEGSNPGCPSAGSPQTFTQGAIANTSANAVSTLFYLKNPTPNSTAGQTCNVDVTFTGTSEGLVVGAVMFTNVSTSTAPTFPTPTHGTSRAPSITLAVPTSPATSAAMVALAKHGANQVCPVLAGTSTSNPTLQFALSAGGTPCSVNHGTLAVATATTSGTVNFTLAASTQWGVTAIEFTAASNITAVKVQSLTAAPYRAAT